MHSYATSLQRYDKGPAPSMTTQVPVNILNDTYNPLNLICKTQLIFVLPFYLFLETRPPCLRELARNWSKSATKTHWVSVLWKKPRSLCWEQPDVPCAAPLTHMLEPSSSVPRIVSHRYRRQALRSKGADGRGAAWKKF